jgi:class 3 adenylate cyclase/tetratricopeptide (TPR) repeat protein
MPICSSCGQDNRAGARFCDGCGASLVAATPGGREERKVVSVLFCDVVGFTARAERMDPEEVRRFIAPLHARLRLELERHGGTVEKFIGDAVMALFGAPTAHEDDPERAVRAALAIVEALAQGGGVEVRIGITTGEALIALGARPELGEGIASGDVVNTAARLQAAAPVGGILVDTTTYRATERAIEYDEAAPVVAKGKAEPVRVWRALRAASQVGVERPSSAPLVGRARELSLLRDTFARVRGEREPQLVTLVGVPGIGKSRLVFELSRELAPDSERICWRRGRSLPYGEGITFWALGEIVKAHAGILDSDSPEDAREKLRATVAGAIADPEEATWVEGHLRPLAGLEAGGVGAGDRSNEAYAAWRRFLEALAEERPLVLVFEDLHWADDALLDFIAHLLDWAGGVPLLVLATARPELLGRRSGWGGGKLNSSTILLSPLTEAQTEELLQALLGRALPGDEAQRNLLERAGGNPLYAEEFVRMLSDRGEQVALPESIQGIIAARLDSLPGEEKELLQHAAVIGRVFWLGALGSERWRLEESLHSLERKEFVRRERRSSVAGEVEYAFSHALVRDVAYEQIPRSRRASRHRAAAQWIESLGRAEDHAEMLAHHQVQALEYAEAAGEQTQELAGAAIGALQEAGDRALSLNAYAAASRYYEHALALVQDQRTRCDLLLSLGDAQARAGDTPSAQQSFRIAADLAEELGLHEHLARAALGYGGRFIWEVSRDDAEHRSLLERALAALGEEESPLRVRVLARLAGGPLRDASFAPERRRSLSQEAVAIARRIGDPATLAYALSGYSGARLSPAFTPEQLEVATELVQLAMEAGDEERVADGLEQRAVALIELGDLRAAKADLATMAGLAEKLRQPSQDWFAAVYGALVALLEGRFAEAESLSSKARRLGERAQSWGAAVTYELQLYVLRRDQGRLGEVEQLVRRAVREHPTYPIWRCVYTQMVTELGETAEARESLDALAADRFSSVAFDEGWLAGLGMLTETARALGDTERASLLYELLLPYGERVAIAFPEFSTGAVARSLGLAAATLERWDDAERHFQNALALNDRLGARPWLARSQEDYARMLFERGGPGDEDRAQQLLLEARNCFSELGMKSRARRAAGLPVR